MLSVTESNIKAIGMASCGPYTVSWLTIGFLSLLIFESII